MNLFKALGYKEWIKTRRIIGVLVALTLGVLAYSFIEINHNIRLNDAVNEWYMYLFMDTSLPSVTQVLPLLSGVVLALVQFVPEMVNKRLKLTLHLPADEEAIVASMLGYGYLVLILLFSLTVCVYVIGLSYILPSEVITTMMSRLAPAFASGIAAYGFTSWICFEPQWRQRVLNTFVAVGLLSVFFVSAQSAVYMHFGIGFLILIIASCAFPFFSVLRFKHGVL